MSRDGAKTGGRNWVPGQSGNPNGQPILPEEIRQLRREDKVKVEQALRTIARMTKLEVIQKIADPKSSLMELMIGRLFIEAISKGCPIRTKFIFELMIAPFAKKLELDLSSSDGTMTPTTNVILQIPANNRDAGT